ncbi:MAG TPA: site-specific integrase [Streptosporangiaceae bacterium]|nr:site-specific integrase [Streptosporangiaceae bacterium]
MRVQQVVIAGSGTWSWTVFGDDDVPVVPVDRFLAYLTDVGRSPNTVKAYAHDLKDFWEFLGFRGVDWREARLEDVGEFVAWLQLPPAGRSGAVAVLPSAAAQVTAATVNRKLAAVSAFYAHQAQRREGRRPPGRVEGRRAGRVEAVPASHQQGEAVSQAGDHAQGPGETAARHNSYRVKRPGDHGTRHPGPATISLVNLRPHGLPVFVSG